MSAVSKDKDFERKVAAGAEALLKQWDINPDNRKTILPTAKADARAVLIAAAALKHRRRPEARVF